MHMKLILKVFVSLFDDVQFTSLGDEEFECKTISRAETQGTELLSSFKHLGI
jgi:hypothetical protein